MPRSTPAATTALLALLISGATGLVAAGVVGNPSPDPVAGRAAAALYPATGELTPVPHPRTPRPGYLTGSADPVFGTVVTRVSDQRALGSDSRVLRHAHAKRQPWNADGSLLLLGHGDPGYLLDGRTFEPTGRTLARGSAGVWSSTDPNAFYAVDGNRLVAVSARAGTATVLHEFEGMDLVDIGDAQGSPSNDDRLLVLIGRGPAGTALISYDPRGRRVLAQRLLEPGQAEALSWVTASQSGRYVVVNWRTSGSGPGEGVDLYDRELQLVRHLHDVSQSADTGYDPSGREVLVTFDSEAGKADGDRQLIVAVGLDDGVLTPVLRTDWTGTHLSCRNTDRPGWCYVSDSEVAAPGAAGYDEVFAVRLDGSGQVQRFAHAHQSPGVPDDWTSLAVPSRDGTRVLWASDWGLGTTAPAYAYVASVAPLARRVP